MDRYRNVDDELAYMDHRAPEITPAWSAEGGRFDYDAQKYVPKTASADVDAATVAFKRVQWRYLQNSEILPKGKSFNLENTHNWNEVIEMAKDAASKYEQKGRGINRLLRKGGVALGNAGDLTTAWVQLLPAGDYGSIVSGGIKLIFSACMHMNDVRTAVMDTLEKLPDSLQTPEQYLDLYKEDKDLLRMVEVLYMALLEALEKMLIWLEHKTLVHGVKALIRQGSYESETMASISAIKPVSDRVTSQIEFCFQSRVKDIYRHMVEVKRQTANTNKHTAQLALQVPQILKQTEHNGEQMEELLIRFEARTGLFSVLDESKKMAQWREEDEERRERERQEDKQRYLEAERRQQATERALLMVQEQLSRSTTPVNISVVQYVAVPAAPTISPSELFAILRPNLSIHTADNELVLSDGSRLESIESRRGTWLMRQPVFQNWFGIDASCILVVDGQERDRPITSLSYLTAVLSQGLQNDPKCAVLSYFCGLHNDYFNSERENSFDTEIGTAVSIMRCLIGQLLVKTQLSFDTRTVDDNLLSWVERNDLSALSALFRTLITTCASSTIFILIDGISWLETRPDAEIEDTQRMFKNFRFLVQELSAMKSYRRGQGRRAANIKILLTSARPSMEFQQYFNEGDCFSMPLAPAIGAGRFFGDHVLVETELMEQGY